jgi:hypothetical protein
MLLLRARGDKLLRVSVAHVETSLRAANVVDRAYVQHSDRRAAPDVALRPIVDWSDLDFDDGRLSRSTWCGGAIILTSKSSRGSVDASTFHREFRFGARVTYQKTRHVDCSSSNSGTDSISMVL